MNVAFRTEQITPDGAEECTLMDFDADAESRRRHTHHSGNAYDEDDSPHGANRVQCATH